MQLWGFMIVVAVLNALFLLTSFHFSVFHNIFSTPAILTFMQTVFPLTRALSFNYWHTSNHKERAPRNFCKLDQCSLEGGGLRASWVDYLENATRGVFFFLILEPKITGASWYIYNYRFLLNEQCKLVMFTKFIFPLAYFMSDLL